ncbi:class I SAM-dependent methyltransferase [Nonlabens xiamenensis]|uniref:class I SAM-dependent methyltransferase n=1 Tax=Nonlabens xiamenensis TaxID=2341043 RepID=UPI0013DE6C99|nr:class I SAM-dependent methyltransferase [Nonlabens xiamenensis]
MDYQNKSEVYYANVRPEMLKYLPDNPSRILDIGCADGSFGWMVKEKTKAEIWGIEYMPEQANQAAKKLDKVFSGPCEKHISKLPDAYFDVIFCNDVLEHLVDPYEVLDHLKSKIAPDGILVSSIPNVRYHNTFMRVIFQKDWKYHDHGVMDKTHLRFFTGKSIKRMYEEAGYEVIRQEGLNKSRSIKPILYNIPVLFKHMDIRYPQYATVARPKT